MTPRRQARRHLAHATATGAALVAGLLASVPGLDMAVILGLCVKAAVASAGPRGIRWDERLVGPAIALLGALGLRHLLLVQAGAPYPVAELLAGGSAFALVELWLWYAARPRRRRVRA